MNLPLFCINLALAMFLLGVTTGSVNNAILWSVELKDRSFARALLNFGSYVLGRVPAPIIAGYLKETWGWRWTFFFLGSQNIVALIAMLSAYFHAKSAVKKEEIKRRIQQNEISET